MKKMIRILAMALCLIVALSSMVACDMLGGLLGGAAKIEKSEIPDNTVYQFSGIQNVTIENNEDLEGKEDTFLQMFADAHVLYYRDENLNVFEKRDSLLCKDGTITFTDYGGEGSASFINGIRIYAEYETFTHTLGTYEGATVTIDKSLEENTYYIDAYLTGDTFVVCAEEVDPDGTVIKYQAVFKAVQ